MRLRLMAVPLVMAAALAAVEILVGEQEAIVAVEQDVDEIDSSDLTFQGYLLKRLKT